uniref:Restriction endonuclease n=1 Tax=Podoviridae sp. ct7K12 TaxID=2826540 RepID=A0A8S5N7W0_9CAUD|nr:MAG TPA: Restriction endonuclease [Podoviridae sp. ct7K12]
MENRDLKLKLSSLSGEIKKNIEAIEDDKFGKIENYDEIISKEKIDFKNLKYYEILDYYLKKYKEKNKSKLRIGYEFERYCGYLLEQLGFSVRYHGIINGKADEGIDLIAEKNKKIVYVQCKYWSITKTIRENTVAQLLGATLKKFLETGKKTEDFFKSIKNKDIEMLLITKTVLSDEAKEFCKLLNVTYRENVTIDFDYPMVKLVENEEKIYYIPTDLQYDNIIFNSTNKKYSRVMSCEEATKLGYRHCYKWKGNYL